MLPLSIILEEEMVVPGEVPLHLPCRHVLQEVRGSPVSDPGHPVPGRPL